MDQFTIFQYHLGLTSVFDTVDELQKVLKGWIELADLQDK